MDEGEADLEESLFPHIRSRPAVAIQCVFLVTRRFTKHKNGPVNRVVCLALFFSTNAYFQQNILYQANRDLGKCHFCVCLHTRLPQRISFKEMMCPM